MGIMRTILVVGLHMFHSLNQLAPMASAVIQALNVGQDLRRRMSGLGLRPGARVQVIRTSPLNGPIQIRVGHTDLILRRSEAARIEVAAAAA